MFFWRLLLGESQDLFHETEFFFSILEIKDIQIINTVGAQLHGLVKIFLAKAVPSRVLTGLSLENPLSQSAVVTLTHILRIVAL